MSLLCELWIAKETLLLQFLHSYKVVKNGFVWCLYHSLCLDQAVLLFFFGVVQLVIELRTAGVAQLLYFQF